MKRNLQLDTNSETLEHTGTLMIYTERRVEGRGEGGEERREEEEWKKTEGGGRWGKETGEKEEGEGRREGNSKEARKKRGPL